MKWLFIFSTLLMPLSVVSSELPEPNPYIYPSDPLIDRQRASQRSRIFWEPANSLEDFVNSGQLAISAGESAVFELTAQNHLRLQTFKKKQQPPILWLSHDGQLWRQGSWTPGEGDQEWFYIDNTTSPVLARLEAETDFAGRLFISKFEYVDSPSAYFQVPIPSNVEKLDLSVEKSEASIAQRLDSREIFEVEVEGPMVIALATRPDENQKAHDDYSISWALDSIRWQHFSIERSRISTKYQKVGASSLHGAMDRHYLAIPEGRKLLKIKSSHSIFLRIEKAIENYFFDFNEPEPTIAELTKELLDKPITTGTKSLMEVDLLRQSNHIEGAPDIAIAYLQQQKASSTKIEPSGVKEALASKVELSQRFFRNLYPVQGSKPLKMNNAWFATSSPLNFEADQTYYLTEKVLDRLSKGLFVEVNKETLAYTLPKRYGPSQLRLSIVPLNKLKNTDLWIQYDDAQAQRLRLTDSVLQKEVSLPEDALLSKRALEEQARLHTTMSGEFNSSKGIGHYWPVSNVVLALPVDVKEVRVWSEASHVLALQYRASQAYQVDEITYRQLIDQITQESPLKLFHQTFKSLPESGSSEALPPDSSPTREVSNQWYPMLRYLHASQAAYLDDFRNEYQAEELINFSARLQKANIKAHNEDWIGVLEILGKSGYGHTLEAYQLSQKALKHLGEHYLASRQQRATAVFSPNLDARRQATEDLLTEYAKSHQWESQVSLLAARFLREGDSQLINGLGEALHHAGYSYWSSQLGQLVSKEKGIPDWLPLAAQEAGWLHTAGKGQKSHLNLGDVAAANGKTDIAKKHWSQAGPEGIKRIARMDEAESIASALKGTNQKQRLAGIERWMKWTLSPQQRFDWVSLGDRLKNSRGFSTLFSDITRKPLSLPHTTNDAPVEVEVIGPAILRVQLRATESDNHQEKEMDWLVTEFIDVSGDKKSTIAPIINFAENPYLKSVTSGLSTAIGNDILLEVPAGLHLVRLKPQKNDYLTQIWQWEPKHSWAVLPPLKPLVLKSLLQAPNYRNIAVSNIFPKYMNIEDGAMETLPVLSSTMLHTLSLVSPKAYISNGIVESLSFPTQTIRPNDWPVGSYAVQVENIDLNKVGTASAKEAYEYAVALLWELEKNPELLDFVSARLAQLETVHSEIPSIARLAGDFLEGYNWKRVSSSFESAGVRQLSLRDEMQSPYVRVRQALLDGLSPSAILLTGRTIEGVEFFTTELLNITINLTQLVLPYEAKTPAEVMIQIDDNESQSVRLIESESSIHISLQPGNHALRLWLKEPKQQQFVSVQVNRTKSGVPLVEDETQSFHIASPGEPASFYVKGPAWVRIDEWSQQDLSRKYRYIDEGWQTLTLEGGEEEDKYYRLYTLRQSSETYRPLETPSIKASLATPFLESSLPKLTPEPISWKTEDRYSLGPGTSNWGGYLGFVERTDGNEDDVLPAQGLNATEAGISFRFQQPEKQLFGRSDLFMRRFDGGQELLGAKQWFDLYSKDNEWLVGLFGEAYFQPNNVEGLGDNHWAVRLQGSVRKTFVLSEALKHEPEITLNQRWMSLDSVPLGVLSELDPDIYSPYKDDHKRSLILSDRLTWTPNYDQRAYFEGALISNESLNPFDLDHLQMTTAVRQLFGSVAGEAGFRWRHYLNDNDRDKTLNRKRVFMGGDVIRWGAGDYALTIRGEVSYDIELDGFGWILRIGYESNAGRMSAAKRPRELDFLQLRRSQQQQQLETNKLEPVYP